LSLEEDFGTMDTLAIALETKYKGQKWASEFVAQVASVRALAVGQLGPLFSQTTPDGKMLGPADFKGKIVVLDFWASWCKPCRANSPAMVALYAKYKANGVEILGVSLDSKPDSWKKAIKEDNYTWPQVSELNMWDNSAAKLYKVEGIPHLVLLDKEGKIVARNLTPESVDILLTNMLTVN
jgi:peroxiredoxin